MEKKIETNLIQAIGSSEIKNITVDFCEIGLDSILEDGLIKDIPILGTIAKLYSAGSSIHGKIFEKKVINFLFELNKTSEEERIDFIEKINSDEKQAQRIGEHLLVILDRLDDLKKPRILARIMAELMKGKIDYEMFVRLSSVVDKSLVSDLNKLKEFQKSQFASYTATSLENAGLVNMYLMTENKYDEDGVQTDGARYAITSLGEILVKIL